MSLNVEERPLSIEVTVPPDAAKRSQALRKTQRATHRDLRAFRLDPEEYAALTLSRVCAAVDKPLVPGTRLHAVLLGLTAAHILTATTGTRSEAVVEEIGDLGPYAEAVDVLVKHLNRVSPNHPETELSKELVLIWGPDCQRILRRARRKSSRLWRPVTALETWLRDVTDFAPRVSKWIYVVLAYLLGIATNHFLRK